MAALARVRAGLQALDAGIPQGYPEYVLHQMVTVMRGGEEVKLSKRAGSYLTLARPDRRSRPRCDALVPDRAQARFAARVRHRSRALADRTTIRSTTCSYAHARICGLLRQLNERGLSFDLDNGLAQPLDLDSAATRDLLTDLSRYPEVVVAAGEQLEPHLLTVYLHELAQAFQTYYNDHQFLVDDADTRDARLALALATRQVLANGLGLLGVSAPEAM